MLSFRSSASVCLFTNLSQIFDVGKKQFGCVQRADPTPSGAGSAGQKLKTMVKKAGENIEQNAK